MLLYHTVKFAVIASRICDEVSNEKMMAMARLTTITWRRTYLRKFVRNVVVFSVVSFHVI